MTSPGAGTGGWRRGSDVAPSVTRRVAPPLPPVPPPSPAPSRLVASRSGGGGGGLPRGSPGARRQRCHGGLGVPAGPSSFLRPVPPGRSGAGGVGVYGGGPLRPGSSALPLGGRPLLWGLLQGADPDPAHLLRPGLAAAHQLPLPLHRGLYDAQREAAGTYRDPLKQLPPE